MKKMFLFTFLLVLLSGLVLGGLAAPHPVYGHITIDGAPVKNLEVRISNLNTGVTGVSRTNGDGFFQTDLGNVDQNYRGSDSVKVSLVYCETQSSSCSRTVSLSEGGTEVSFDASTTPPLPSDSVVVKYVCWNDEGVADASDCPPVPVVEPVVVIECADGSVVDTVEECPEESNSWWAWIIGLLAAAFASLAGGSGWKFYNGKFKHYHRGPKGYHPATTRHSKLKYRHTTWKESPIQCMKDVKKIQQGIDLSKEE